MKAMTANEMIINRLKNEKLDKRTRKQLRKYLRGVKALDTFIEHTQLGA